MWILRENPVFIYDSSNQLPVIFNQRIKKIYFQDFHIVQFQSNCLLMFSRNRTKTIDVYYLIMKQIIPRIALVSPNIKVLISVVTLHRWTRKDISVS